MSETPPQSDAEYDRVDLHIGSDGAIDRDVRVDVDVMNDCNTDVNVHVELTCSETFLAKVLLELTNYTHMQSLICFFDPYSNVSKRLKKFNNAEKTPKNPQILKTFKTPKNNFFSRRGHPTPFL